MTGRVGWVLLWIAAGLPVQLAAQSATIGDLDAAGALRLRMSRPSDVWLESARQRLAGSQVAEAARMLLRLQQEAGDRFVGNETTVVTGDWAAAQFWRTLTPRDHQLAQEVVAGAADGMWQRWETQRQLDDLLTLCGRYGFTASGLRGWRTLAAVARDRQQWSLADAALNQVMRHALTTSSQRTTALAQRLEIAIQRRDTSAVSTFHEELHAFPPRTMLRIAGQAMTVQDWLDRLPTSSMTVAAHALSRPSLQPLWQRESSYPEALQGPWNAWLSELRSQGAWPLPAADPLVLGDRVLLRTVGELTAYSLATGDVLWQTSQEPWQALQKSPLRLENDLQRWQFLEQSGRRTAADSLTGRLSSRENLVYAIQEANDVGPDARQSPFPGPNAEPNEQQPPPFNYLAAFDVADGRLAWRVGGSSAGPTYSLGREFFCGPPTILDDIAFVIGQQQNELRLHAIHAERGELLWSVVLGDTPRPLPADPARQRLACPILWHDGVLLCPTASGALIAVDPLTRSARWAYRYRVNLREKVYRARGESTAYLPDCWWDAWREISLQPKDDLAILASSESDELHAVDVRTGGLRWRVPRQRGLFFRTMTTDHALVIEPYAVRGHGLRDGKVAWRTEVGEIAGRGTLSPDGTEYLQPLADGHCVVLDPKTGAVRTNWSRAEFALGNLLPAGQGWIVNHPRGLIRLPDVEVVLAGPTANGGLIRGLLERGRVAAASELLAKDTDSADERWRRQVQLALLEETPSRWRVFAESLAGSATDTAQRVESVLALSRAAARTGTLVEAGRLILAALERATEELILVAGSPRRRVRADAALLGAWDDLHRHADVEHQRELEALLQARWDAAASSTDPFALQRLDDLYRPLAFTRERLSRHGPALFLGRSLWAIELRCLEAAQRPAGQLDPTTVEFLAAQLDELGFPRDAAGYRQRLSGSVAATIDPWPPEIVQIESTRQRNDDVYQWALPLDVESDGLFDALDVGVQRMGQIVRFAGGGERGVWELRLPASNSNIRPSYQLYQGWGRGRLLILRCGTELFAIAPFDERGSPNARLLWTLDTTGGLMQREGLQPETIPGRPGIREEEYRINDGYGRPIGHVGPVRARYLCYQEKGKLVAVDTLTGQRLWERFDVPLSGQTSGDDDVVLLWDPDHQTVEVIRAIDGATLRTQTWTVARDDVLLQRDRRAWHWATTAAGSQLVCTDVAEDRELWQREASRLGVPFVLDARTLGLADANRVVLLDADSGQPRGEPVPLDVPSEIARVSVSRDADRWYVILSRKVEQQYALQQLQIRSSYRAPFVSGQLAAIDRQTGRLEWTSVLDREAWSLDQPRSAPLLMQAYKLSTPDLTNQRPGDGLVRVFDKRTGQEVFARREFNLSSYVALDSDPDRGVVDLRLENEIIRLRYTPAPPPPPQPEP